MSFLSGLESFFVTVESDVIKTIANIQQGLGAAAHEIQAGLNWIESNSVGAIAVAKQISAVAAMVTPEVTVLNPAAGAAMTAGVAALNLASDALDSFSAQMKAGGSSQALTDATALLAAYHTLKSTQAATATLAAAVATPIAK